MNSLIRFYQSSIGKKWIVALTGLVLVGYVLGHLAGNLQIYLGQDQLNKYALFLHSMGPLLWVIRIFLIAAFIAHITVTIQLSAGNRAARPDAYAEKKSQRSTLASRTMIMSGLIVLCFVIYHLLHFTVRVIPKEFADYHDSIGRHDTYRMVVEGFLFWPASIFYVLGVGLLCVHLSHGFSSFLQTMGLTNVHNLNTLVRGGRILAVLVFLGYTSIPVSVLTGLIKPPPAAESSSLPAHSTH